MHNIFLKVFDCLWELTEYGCQWPLTPSEARLICQRQAKPGGRVPRLVLTPIRHWGKIQMSQATLYYRWVKNHSHSFRSHPLWKKKCTHRTVLLSDKHVVTQCCLYIRRLINNIFIFFFNIRLERKNLFLTSDMQIAILNTAEGLIPDF